MTELQSLIDRVTEGEGGDGKLDHDILIALGMRYELDWGPEFYLPDGTRFYAHELTASFDDALALVKLKLPDFVSSAQERFSGHHPWVAEVYGTGGNRQYASSAANAARALLAACLIAIEKEQPQ